MYNLIDEDDLEVELADSERELLKEEKGDMVFALEMMSPTPQSPHKVVASENFTD